MLFVPPAAVVVNDDLIALAGTPDRRFPGNIQLLLRMTAHARHDLRRSAQLLQLSGKRCGILVDQKAVFAVRHALGRAGTANHDRCRSAGCRLAHDESVGVKRGGKQEQIRPGIPRAQRFACGNRTGEEAAIVQALLKRVLTHLRAVGAVPDKHHAEIGSALPQGSERVEDHAQSFIPHQPPDKKKHRHAVGQVVILCRGKNGLLLRAAARQVHAVFHDDIVPLVAKRAQILPRAAADHPYLIAGADILNKCPDRSCLQYPAANRLCNVDIEFRVIGQHQRRVHHIAKRARQQTRRHRAVCMQQLHMRRAQPPGNLRRKRIARHISHKLPRVDAWVAQDRKRKAGIVRARDAWRRHNGVSIVFLDDFRIVDDRICNTVDSGRKGIVQKADRVLFHWQSSL